MKNIIEICKDFGIEIPAEKHADFLKAVNGEYKTVADYNKQVDKTAAAEKRAKTAEETLKGFEGKDFDTIIKERDEWKRKHDENEAAYKKEQEEREFNELLASSITDAKGKNAKAITALLDVEKLRNSRNQQADIKAALDSLRAESGYLFDDEGGKAKFTAPGGGNPQPGKKYSMGELMRMKNENPQLDIKQFMNNGGND